MGIQADVVFLGDSITAGGDWESVFADIKVVTLAVPGDSLEGVRQRARMVETVGAERVFLLAGVNNISRGNYEKTIEREYEQLLTKLLNMDVEVYVQTIMPVREPSKVNNERIRKANEIIAVLAKKYDFHLIDTYSVMVDDDGKLKEEYSRDGVHLTSAGYEQWYAELREYFE